MKKSMRVLLSVVGVLLILSAFEIAVLFGVKLGQNVFSLSLVLSTVINILTSLFGAAYIFTGAMRHPGGVFLKLYLILSTLDIVALFIFEETTGHVIPTVCQMLALAGYCVLTFVPEPGRKCAESIALCITMIHLFLFADEVLFMQGFGLGGLEETACLMIDISLDLLIFAKYEDRQTQDP